MKVLIPQVYQSPKLNKLLKVVSHILLVTYGILLVFFIHGLDTMKDTLHSSINDLLLFYGLMFNFLIYLLLIILALNNFHKWKNTTGLLFIIISLSVLALSSVQVYPFNIGSPFQNVSLSLGIGLLIIGITLIILHKISNQTKAGFETVDDSSKRLIGKRLLAIIIDYAIFVFAFVFILSLFGESVPTNDPMIVDHKRGSGISIFLIFWLWIIYFPGLESLNGQTIGKVIAGIQVVRINDNYHPFRVSIIRHAFDVFELVSCGLISFGIMIITKSNRRLGDLAGGSKVVKA